MTTTHPLLSPPLEKLPPELLSTIFLETNSLATIYSLLRSSPRCLQAFLGSKRYILTQFLRARIHTQVWKDAVLVAEAKRLRVGFGSVQKRQRAVERFCKNLDRDEDGNGSGSGGQGGQGALSLETLESMCHLYPLIEHFVTEYASDRAGRPLEMLTQASTEDGPRALVVIDDPLSASETGRLQRAFYRLELFGLLFNERGGFSRGDHWDLVGQGPFSPMQQAQMLFRYMSSWELEELACARDFVMQSLIRVFNGVEARFIDRWEAQLRRAPDPECVDGDDSQITTEDGNTDEEFDEHLQSLRVPLAIATRILWKDLPFFNKEHKSLHPHYMDYMTTLGLRFIKQLILHPIERDVIANCRMERSIRQALQAPSSVWRDVESQEYTPSLPVPGDLRTCNEGWSWAGILDPDRSWNRLRRLEMRYIGYVFWDKGRLADCGLLEQNPARIANRGLSSTFMARRHPRLSTRSVEEMLTGTDEMMNEPFLSGHLWAAWFYYRSVRNA
ncbi:MAG: hypothetical protein MMC33_004706 [Icmadophila ericetorum]|nr:hypothetical protein [Icmadophila ericetorum]